MNWQDIKVSSDNTHFLFSGQKVFTSSFLEVLKFHEPGSAPVRDNSGWYHIDVEGKQLYPNRYTRTFGFYCNRAAVVQGGNWFHLTDRGERAYKQMYSWIGNYQEDICTVRESDNYYVHIDSDGSRLYPQNYIYSGDFKDGVACVKTDDGLYRHIDPTGKLINGKTFLDLGIFHKNFAIAKDEKGWHHINKSGQELYQHRYAMIEPFYNGCALVTRFDMQKIIINEQGQKIITV